MLLISVIPTGAVRLYVRSFGVVKGGGESENGWGACAVCMEKKETKGSTAGESAIFSASVARSLPNFLGHFDSKIVMAILQIPRSHPILYSFFLLMRKRPSTVT
jgi:hypothetical protein